MTSTEKDFIQTLAVCLTIYSALLWAGLRWFKTRGDYYKRPKPREEENSPRDVQCGHPCVKDSVLCVDCSDNYRFFRNLK